MPGGPTTSSGTEGSGSAVPGRRSSSRRRGYAAAIAVAVILVAELLARVAAPHLPVPQVWPTPESQHKYDQIAALGRADAVIFGSLLADDGFDPSALGAAAGHLVVYNVGLAGEAMGAISSWAQVVVRRLHPKVVVLGLSVVEVNVGVPEAALEDTLFRDSDPVRHVLGGETFLQWLTREGGDISTLVKIRNVLRDPSTWGDRDQNGTAGAGGPNNPQLDDLGMSQLGVGGAYDHFLGQLTSPQLRYDQYVDDVFHDFAVGPSEVATIASLISFCQARGIAVVVADMPISAEGLTYLPHGMADYQAGQTALQQLATTAKVPFVATGEWETSLFADPGHLNGVGAVRMSQLVAPLVGKLIGAPGGA